MGSQQMMSAAARLAPRAPDVTSLPNIYSPPLRELISLLSTRVQHAGGQQPTSSSAYLLNSGGTIGRPVQPLLLTAGGRPAWPALALAEPPLGKYTVLLENHEEEEGGRVRLLHGPEAAPLQQEVFTAVLNASHLLPFRGLTHDERELMYFTKEDLAASSTDILQLRQLGGRINLTVHEGGEGGAKSAATAAVVDVRLHLEASVVNIRYGTSPQKEASRLLRHALRAAGPRVWEREAESVRWTAKERRQLEASGTVAGYELEYRHSPLSYPELYSDPMNMQVVKSSKRSSHDRHRDQQ